MTVRPSARGKATPEPRPRLRILFGGTTAIGPGKADLLEAIGRTGSISAAGRAMRMSYRRAWLLVDEMNAAFVRPLVASKAGGTRGGGAALTRLGRDVLTRYRAMERTANTSTRRQFHEFARLLARPRARP